MIKLCTTRYRLGQGVTNNRARRWNYSDPGILERLVCALKHLSSTIDTDSRGRERVGGVISHALFLRGASYILIDGLIGENDE